MDLIDFNCNCLNKLLENISKERKSIFLLRDFYVKILERNWNNTKNTWKGINSLVSLNTTSSLSTVLSLDNGETITNPYDIANTFNNYFTSFAEIRKKAQNIHITFFRLYFK